ncbi:MAG: hypothetical protein CEE43_14785 [Promethearchaeota archaeon Loki_b32]|nr:MAG: hypothetical protein CEE43_14785 [Candidatus Lokiarchaeota archaeon Loki_b32]
MDENQKFEEIVNRGLEEYFKRNPRIAVQFGKEEYEKEVESGIKEHLVENLKWFSEWIDELKQLDVEKLNFENQISLKAMEYYHNLNLFMHEAFPLWKKEPNGLAYFQETVFLLFQRKGPVTSVAEVIIAHLSNLPKYLEEFQSRFDETPIPKVWRDLALEQVQSTPKSLQTLAEAFSETADISESLKNKLLITFKEVESVIQTHVEWIKSLPVDNDEFAWALGPEKFDKLLSLRKIPWDRKTLIKKGNEIFSSAFKKIKQITKEIYPKKTLSEAIEAFFKEDQIPNFQEVLEYTLSEAKRAKKFIESHNLATIPQEKLVIVETPFHLIPIIPGAAYVEAPYFRGDQPGIFMISPTQKDRHSYTYVSDWMIHEAYPGHHLDFVCNNTFTPLIRLLGVTSYTSMETVEGWALYCEEMMLHQGFYKDPVKTQQLISGLQVGRAMNLMLDIQLHCKQRSMADASKMLMNVLAMGEATAKAVILGYTTTPVYPLSYLIGKLLIDDLRQEVEEKMGNKFSLKFFHDTILRSGDLPYYLLKEYFEEKIKNL